jgi:hypothetical protein
VPHLVKIAHGDIVLEEFAEKVALGGAGGERGVLHDAARAAPGARLEHVRQHGLVGQLAQ